MQISQNGTFYFLSQRKHDRLIEFVDDKSEIVSHRVWIFRYLFRQTRDVLYGIVLVDVKTEIALLLIFRIVPSNNIKTLQW